MAAVGAPRVLVRVRWRAERPIQKAGARRAVGNTPHARAEHRIVEGESGSADAEHRRFCARAVVRHGVICRRHPDVLRPNCARTMTHSKSQPGSRRNHESQSTHDCECDENSGGMQAQASTPSIELWVHGIRRRRFRSRRHSRRRDWNGSRSERQGGNGRRRQPRPRLRGRRSARARRRERLDFASNEAAIGAQPDDSQTGRRSHRCRRRPKRGADRRLGEADDRAFGGVDLLFTNAGGPPAGAALSFDDAAWQNAIDLLLFSTLRMVRAVVPSMKQRGGGAILMSTSSSVKEPIANLGLSTVIRASVSALAKTLAIELARRQDPCQPDHSRPHRHRSRPAARRDRRQEAGHHADQAKAKAIGDDSDGPLRRAAGVRTGRARSCCRTPRLT